MRRVFRACVIHGCEISAAGPACDDSCHRFRFEHFFVKQNLKPFESTTELARRAKLLLVVGSSLNVHPVAELPQETLGAGGKLAIVNRSATPFDERAELTIDAGAGERS